jgi:hypothetical protein
VYSGVVNSNNNKKKLHGLFLKEKENKSIYSNSSFQHQSIDPCQIKL